MLLLTMVLPTATSAGPLRTVREQVRNRNGKIVVRIEQPLTVAHDSVAIGVGIAREGDVESVFQADHTRHRVRR